MKTKKFRKYKITKTRRRKYKTNKYKLRGGENDECHICMQEKEMLIIKPCEHKICIECFNKLKNKICPFCREPIQSLVRIETNDDGIINEKTVFPRQLGTDAIENIHIHMENILASLPARTNFNNWKSLIKNRNSKWILIIGNELSKLSEDEIREMFNKFSNYIPNMIYNDLKKYFADYIKKHYGITISVNGQMGIGMMKLFLAYTIVVEAPVDNYISRVNEYFGW